MNQIRIELVEVLGKGRFVLRVLVDDDEVIKTETDLGDDDSISSFIEEVCDADDRIEEQELARISHE